SLVKVSTICSCVTSGGRSTSDRFGTSIRCCFIIIGVITMKMIRRTSRTSIIGVTFISARKPFLPTCMLMLERLDLFGGEANLAEARVVNDLHDLAYRPVVEARVALQEHLARGIAAELVLEARAQRALGHDLLREIHLVVLRTPAAAAEVLDRDHQVL